MKYSDVKYKYKYHDKKEYLEFLVKNNASVLTEDFQKQDRLPIDVLNDHDWDEISKTYNNENVVVIDNFLKEEYTDRLRKFCLNFPYVDNKWSDYGGLNFSKKEDDIWFPLLTNITEDILNSAPFLKDKELVDAWAHIYRNNSNGTPLHTDNDAEITFNLWITPTESMEPIDNYNGIEIWKIEPPDDWGIEDCNGNLFKINNYLAEQKPEKIVIPYKFNRVILFNSRFFHRSCKVSCKPGWENKRINCVFLYK